MFPVVLIKATKKLSLDHRQTAAGPDVFRVSLAGCGRKTKFDLCVAVPQHYANRFSHIVFWDRKARAASTPITLGLRHGWTI